MTTTVEYVKGQKLTKEQIMEIEKAKKKPIVYDEDSPELTPAMEKAFALAAKNRNRQGIMPYFARFAQLLCCENIYIALIDKW